MEVTNAEDMLVNTTINDRICYVEMQNAEHFNCLSEAMCQELCDAIQSGYDKECVGIVIKAQCKKGVWSAGHDIRELPQNGEDPLGAYQCLSHQGLSRRRLSGRYQIVPRKAISSIQGKSVGFRH